VVQTYNEGEEAQYVVSEIDRLKREHGISPLDCAVMFRVNAQSRALEEAFMRHGIPYRLVGGLRFYQRREIKDVIAYLKFIHNPDDNISLSRIFNTPGRGIGPRTVNELSSWAGANGGSLYQAMSKLSDDTGPQLGARAALAVSGFYRLLSHLIEKSRQLPLSGLLDEVIGSSGYKDYILADEEGKDRWENILELRTVAREYNWLEQDEALAAFLEKVSLVMAEDETEEKPDAATLTTLHQAKGLEFPVVFIVGLEEGLLPHRRSIEDGEIEEERRLCYVALPEPKAGSICFTPSDAASSA
jgi:DNA helicase-2/ATP-dependent DNA helicase PcrA